MWVALETHNETLRKAVEVHAGHVFNYTGDGMCAGFDSPRSAVDAAVAGVQEGAQDVSRATSTVESSRPLSTISGGNPGHRGVAKHSGPQGNSGTAMFARSGTVSSPRPWLCRVRSEFVGHIGS
jgi:hypothetical protein